MSRTMVIQWVKGLIGILVGAGLVSVADQQIVLENLDKVIGGILLISAVVEGWVRKLTSSPLASWWGKK